MPNIVASSKEVTRRLDGTWWGAQPRSAAERLCLERQSEHQPFFLT